MPVTARLSRAFYERLGDEITNELVEWLNAVDRSSRTELRELNELNFARFDAKMGERLADFRTELLGHMDARFARVEDEVRDLKVSIRDATITGIKWTFAFWSITILALIGIYLRT